MLSRLRIYLFTLILCTGGRAEVTSAGPSSFTQVYLVFAEEHSLEFVSGFGHAFVCLAPSEARRPNDLLMAPAVSFGVDTGPAGKGLFVGKYTIKPCFELVRQNAYFQQRRLIFVRLNLSPVELAAARSELQQRLDRDFRYDFYRFNCGYYLKDWLLAAAGKVQGAPGFLSYLTPRKAAHDLIKHFGHSDVVVWNSPGLLAERRLAGRPADVRQHLITTSSQTSTDALTDGELKLLFWQLQEARGSAERYRQIQHRRSEFLTTEAGRQAAREVLKSEYEQPKSLSEVWPPDHEGPRWTVGLNYYSQQAEAGVTLGYSHGIRDELTSPIPPDLLRMVKFLDYQGDFQAGRIRSTFTLGELSTVRDVRALLGVGSSGASVLYNERADALGRSGVTLGAWSGLATRWETLGWFGFRLHLYADQLQSDAQFKMVPELFTFDLLHTGLSAGLFLHTAGDLGADVRWNVRPPSADGQTLQFIYRRDPQAGSALYLSASHRF